MNDPLEAWPTFPNTRELLRIARGFSCLFWGLPLTLLLFFRAVDITVINRLQVPPHLLGVVLLYVGMGLQYFCGVESPQWRRTAGGGLFAAFLLLYLVPFVHWYAVLPRVGLYYTANLLLLAAAVIWFLWAASQLSSKLGAMTGDVELAMEARVCAWSVVGLMLVPLLVVLGFGGMLASRYQSTLISEVHGLQIVAPLWLQAFFLLPLSLTMVTVWKAKERSLQALHTARAGDVTTSGEADRLPR